MKQPPRGKRKHTNHDLPNLCSGDTAPNPTAKRQRERHGNPLLLCLGIGAGIICLGVVILILGRSPEKEGPRKAQVGSKTEKGRNVSQISENTQPVGDQGSTGTPADSAVTPPDPTSGETKRDLFKEMLEKAKHAPPTEKISEYMKLAAWCEQQGLYPERQEVYKLVLADDPDNLTARQALEERDIVTSPLEPLEPEPIETGSDLFKEMLERVKEAPPTEKISEYMKLAAWCEQQGMYPESKEVYRLVRAEDPDNLTANKALGYVRRVGEKWVTAQEAPAHGLYEYEGDWWTQDELERRNLVLYNGKWITREELAQIKEKEAKQFDPKDQLSWVTSVQDAFKQAKERKTLIFTYVWQANNQTCKDLEKNTFLHANFKQACMGYVMLKVEGAKEPEFCAKYEVSEFPTMLILDSKERKKYKTVGNKSISEMAPKLREVLENAKEEELPWVTSLEEAFKAAKDEKTLVFAFIYQRDDKRCEAFEEKTLGHEDFKKSARDYILLKVDQEKNQEFCTKYEVNRYPTVLLLDSEQNQKDKIVGFEDISELISRVQTALAKEVPVELVKPSLIINAEDGRPTLAAHRGDVILLEIYLTT